MSQGLPPRSSQGVVAVSASTTIDAPRDVVWRVLTDWASYREWYVDRLLGWIDMTPFAGTHLCMSNSIRVLPSDQLWRSRNQCLTDPYKRPLPESEQTPRAGAHLLIYPVHIPPSIEPHRMIPAASTFQVITTFDADNYRCAWQGAEIPAWLLSNERWQALVEVVEDGRKKTRYETIEVFGGLLAYVLKFLLVGLLERGFIAMGEGLKRRSEEVTNPRQTPPLN